MVSSWILALNPKPRGFCAVGFRDWGRKDHDFTAEASDGWRQRTLGLGLHYNSQKGVGEGRCLGTCVRIGTLLQRPVFLNLGKSRECSVPTWDKHGLARTCYDTGGIHLNFAVR